MLAGRWGEASRLSLSRPTSTPPESETNTVLLLPVLTDMICEMMSEILISRRPVRSCTPELLLHPRLLLSLIGARAIPRRASRSSRRSELIELAPSQPPYSGGSGRGLCAPKFFGTGVKASRPIALCPWIVFGALPPATRSDNSAYTRLAVYRSARPRSRLRHASHS